MDKKFTEETLGFKPQKVNFYNQHLPYAEDLNDEIKVSIHNIKVNLCKAVIQRDIRMGFIYWANQLRRHIKLYDLALSKEDHVFFINLMLSIATNQKEDYFTAARCYEFIYILLKKKELLSPDDLVVQWRPLYDYYTMVVLVPQRKTGAFFLPSSLDHTFRTSVKLLRLYFPPSATSEMMEEFCPMLCPEDTKMTKAFDFFELFLPTYGLSDRAQPYNLWLKDFLDIWSSFGSGNHWQSALFCILSRVAWDNMGDICWKDHLPLIFNRIVRHYNLPVTYRNSFSSPDLAMDTGSMTMFIIASIEEPTMKTHLTDLFTILLSYFYPSNNGSWSRQINRFLSILTYHFADRVYMERYRTQSWLKTTRPDKRLSEEDITFFVKTVLPITELSTFSKTGCHEAGVIFQKLALLRPQLVLPHLLKQLGTGLETLSEPHRLYASVHCVLKVARPIVLGGQTTIGSEKLYSEGRAMIMPLLFQSLPGIDPNDFQKCMVTFQFIGTFMFLLPVEDYSLAADDYSELNEVDRTVCAQSAYLKEFVLQFLEKCFELIQACSVDNDFHHDNDTSVMNLEENLFELGLSSAFKAILIQASPDIFDAVIERLWEYTRGRCLEIKVSGRLLSVLCRAAARANSEKTLKLFLPPICKLLLTLTEKASVRDQENADNDVLFNLLLLSELTEGNGRDVNVYIPLLTRVLENTLHMKCMKAQKMASSILQCILHSLSRTCFNDSGLFSKNLDRNTNPINLWGMAVPLDELNIVWIEPDEKQRSSVQYLLHKFLIPELDIVRDVTKGDKSYSRERFHQSLIIIHDSLFSGRFLPIWDEELIKLIDMTVDMRSTGLSTTTNELEVQLDDANYPRNVRLAVANTIIDLVDYLLESESDDTKAFCYAMQIYHDLTFFFGISKYEHDSVLKSVYAMKESQRLLQKKQTLRPIILACVQLQHENRILAKNNGMFTSTHKRIVESLWKMSISHYSEVRKKSQASLSKYLREYPHSYKILLPGIFDVLKKDPIEHHKAFKGTLFILHNGKNQTFYVKRDLDTLFQLWPLLVAAQYSEKVSIIKLYDMIQYFLRRDFQTFQLEISGNESAEEKASSSLRSMNISGWEITAERQAAIASKNKSNVDTYRNLVIKLADIIGTGNLHFRRVQLGLGMIRVLIRPNKILPPEGIQAFVNNLISDHIDIRRISMFAMPFILNTLKRKHALITIDPSKVGGSFPSSTIHGDTRPDNRWMQYDKNSINMDKEQWENGIFIHKTYNGWYCWPKTLEVYAPYSKQPPVNRDIKKLSPEELVIYNFFINPNKVDRLIDYLSIEEDKEKDKFMWEHSNVFKRLFRNYGDVFLPNFQKHLTRLAGSTTESHQRCAAEMLSGMVRGTKLWPYEISMNMMELAYETMNIVFAKVLNETLHDWSVCLTTIAYDRDPNRMARLIEMAMEKPLVKEELSSFLVSSRLFLCQMLMVQHEWRVANCAHEILNELQTQISNPYKSIRDRIGLFLFKIFTRSQIAIDNAPTLYPNQSDFIDQVIPQLANLIQGSGMRRSSVVSFYSPNGDTQPEVPLATKIQDQLTLSDNLITVGSCCDRSLDIIQQADSNIVSDISHTKLSPESKMSDVEMLSHESLVSNSGCGFLPGESEERKNAFRLMNTMCKYLMWVSTHGSYSRGIFKFLPYLCHLEETDSDQELSNNCHSTIVCITRYLVSSTVECQYVIGTLRDIIVNRANWWRARCSALEVLQVLIFKNYFWIKASTEDEDLRRQIWEISFDAIRDRRAEIRKMAARLLSGCYHYDLFKNFKETLNIMKQMLRDTKLPKDKSKRLADPEKLVSRHAGILGLCAYTNAHPYVVTADMPEILIILAGCVHDPQPLSTDAKQALSNFKRTHHDNWNAHKIAFSEDQLSILNEVLVSPSYYS